MSEMPEWKVKITKRLEGLELDAAREIEIVEELRLHLRTRADDLERQRLSRAEAERQARMEFGGYQRYKEECREALGTRLLGELIADVRYGLRQLRSRSREFRRSSERPDPFSPKRPFYLRD